MSTTNTLPPMDFDRARMEHLLTLLSLERLDKQGAIELMPMLQKESTIAMDLRYRKVLFKLIDLLDKYIKDEVNLMPDIIISNVANVV